ncbi:MAG: ATP-binding protein [Elusimicrobia bacterium]|nr:ATP-binding protein [Elusimicrobiota bacterium]
MNRDRDDAPAAGGLARWPHTIRWRLLLAILPAVALGIMGIVLMQYLLARREMLDTVRTAVDESAKHAAANVDDLLRQRREDLFTLAESPLFADYYNNIDFQLWDEAETYRRELEKHLLRFSRRAEVYARILYVDPSGRPISVIERDHAGQAGPVPDIFQKVRRLPPGQWAVSGTEVLPDGASAVYYAKPIFDELGRFRGVFILGYDLAQIRHLLRNLVVGKTGRAWIRAADGELDGISARPAGSLVTSRQPIKELPWTLAVEAPLKEFLGPLQTIRNAAILAACLGFLVLVAILRWLVHSITRPVATLAEAARAIGRGDLSHRIAKVGGDELGGLSAAFNEMAGNLESNLRTNAELQGQLIQAEKLSAVGQLVSIVAHELNNPLGMMCNYSEMAMAQDCPPQIRADLATAHKHAKRCEKVVKNLLNFAHRSRLERGRTNLNEVARCALELLEYRLVKKAGVSLCADLAPELPDIIGDFQQLSQVLVNLINNACDAMEESPRKNIVLRTWRQGDRAHVSVTDTGCGIPEEVRGRIFQTFFTTKPVGRGTGLGLAICRQIAVAHGGSIDFTTKSGDGTTFELALPLPAAEELAATDAPPPQVLLAAVPGRRILVADDEPDQAAAIARTLREDGDEVDVATTGTEAVRLARERGYHLVISDFQMGTAKGSDVYQALKAKNPNPRIIFVTGDILNAEVLHFMEDTKAQFLTKPLVLPELQQAARRLLRQA